MQPAVLPTTDGHINFFEDLEHVCLYLSWIPLTLTIR